VGFDLISRAAAYEVLHPKLVKSYLMDALLQKRTVAGKQNSTMHVHSAKRRNRVRKKGSNQQGLAGTVDLRRERLLDRRLFTTGLLFIQHSSGRTMRQTVAEWRTTRDVLNIGQGAQYELTIKSQTAKTCRSAPCTSDNH
jgi:hypothetical protein